MGTLNAGNYDDVTAATNALVASMLRGESSANLTAALGIARRWMPDCKNYTYEEEIANRVDYFLGSMQADMEKEVKRKFPDQADKLKYEQVNLRIVRRMILNKAKVFNPTGETYLVDEKGKRLDPDDPNEITYQDIVKKGKLWSAFQTADQYAQLCRRCAVKPWFDTRAKHPRVSIYPPHKVFFVPNSMYEWDADLAWAQLFERSGAEGLDDSPRYEVWGVRHQEAEQTTGIETIHFLTDGVRDYSINENDENPFIDPLTEKPMYPMVWWQDDDTAALYFVGDQDLLTINRVVNGGLLDLCNNIRFQAFGIPVYTKSENAAGDPPADRPMGPNQAVDLPTGIDLEFRSPGLEVVQVADFWELLIKLEGLIDGQNPTALRVEGREAQSGYALEIENMPVTEHVARMRPFLVPYAEETARRFVVIYNTYAEEHGLTKIDERYTPRVDPGEPKIPVDKQAQSQQAATEIAANVATAVDWRMKLYPNESREQAEQAVKDNAAFNLEIARASVPEVGPPIEDVPDVDVDDAEPVEQEPVDTPDDTEGSGGAGAESVDPEKIIANVYQIVKAIEVDAATAVDLRMALYPDEDRAMAERMVRENQEFNEEMLVLQAEAKLAEKEVLSGGEPEDVDQEPPDNEQEPETEQE